MDDLSTTLKQAIAEGSSIAARFWLPDTADRVPGTLRWRPESGADVDLIGPIGPLWPRDVASHGSPVFGETVAGDLVALVDAWPSALPSVAPFPDVEMPWLRYRANTLAIGAHVRDDDRWSHAEYGTGALHAWMPHSGLSPVHADGDDPLNTMQVRWTRPPPRVVPLDGATLTYHFLASRPWTYGPGFSIETDVRAAVAVEEAQTARELRRNYGTPVECLMVLATGIPDRISFEAVADAAERRAVLVREGPLAVRLEWLRGRPPLFIAEDLPDFQSSLRGWFELYAKAGRAIGLFADSVCEGNVYSPSRLLTVYAALEGYQRECVPGRDRLSRLCAHAGVDRALIGCSSANIALLGAARAYHAHLRYDDARFSVEQVEDGTFPSIRRATALMQACLLRDIGFDVADTERRLAAHYAAWPIP